MSSSSAYGTRVVLTAYRTQSGAMSYAAERPAEPGELCTCGRPARIVYITSRFGPVGYCGLPGARPTSPCPFCGSPASHRAPYGDPLKCPAYRLRPTGPALVTAFDPEVAHVA